MLEDFTVSKLGRVNLIVGKNNSGKSTVLEALRIYAGNANLELLKSITESHDEKSLADDTTYNKSKPFENFFTIAITPFSDYREIVIGEENNSISIQYILTKAEDNPAYGVVDIKIIEPENNKTKNSN
jgi:AAA15 family ATPase/GTPase